MSRRLRHHINPLTFPNPTKADIGNGPFIADIGCGRGEFLKELAKTYPKMRFVGIELRPNIVKEFEKVITKEKLQNIIILQGNASISMRYIFKPDSIKQMFISFPDPWFKPKHKKRTLFTNQFLDESYEALRNGGTIFIQTDQEKLFMEIKDKFSQTKFKEITKAWPKFKSLWEKHKNEHPPYRVVYQKG